ncbi:hypothetical protein [Burkholderia sp. PU8-34]
MDEIDSPMRRKSLDCALRKTALAAPGTLAHRSAFQPSCSRKLNEPRGAKLQAIFDRIEWDTDDIGA